MRFQITKIDYGSIVGAGRLDTRLVHLDVVVDNHVDQLQFYVKPSDFWNELTGFDETKLQNYLTDRVNQHYQTIRDENHLKQITEQFESSIVGMRW